MCLINCKKVKWNKSLYGNIEQVGWKFKFDVYQNEQIYCHINHIVTKRCYVSLVQYKSWIPDKCQMCTV